MWDELTPDMVRLIWGEAVALFRKGEPLFLPPDLEAAAREVQELYEEDDPRVGIVAAYLDRLLPEGWSEMDLYTRRQWLEGSEPGSVERQSVCAFEIWAEALGQNPDRMDAYEGKRIRSLMNKIPKWRHQGNLKTSTQLYGRQRYYKKED
jgi:hypothetical protein